MSLVFLNPSVSVSALMTLIHFTLSNARRFYSSMGNPSDTEGSKITICFLLSRPFGNNDVFAHGIYVNWTTLIDFFHNGRIQYSTVSMLISLSNLAAMGKIQRIIKP